MPVAAEEGAIRIADTRVTVSRHDTPGAVPWADHGVELVLECSGKFKTPDALQPYFDGGVRKVIVAAPVKDPAALNIVMGVNDDLYDPSTHHLLTAASCTTNCLAPVVKVIHEGLGVRHGAITTVHASSDDCRRRAGLGERHGKRREGLGGFAMNRTLFTFCMSKGRRASHRQALETGLGQRL